MLQIAEIRNNSMLLALWVGLYAVALQTQGNGGRGIDPMLWPKAVLLILIALAASSLLWAIHLYRSQRRAAAATTSVEKAKASSDATGFSWRGAAPIAVSILYVVAVGYIGYFIATLLVMPALMAVLEERAKARLVLTPLVFLAFVWLVFIKLATLLLPAGAGLFRPINHFILFGG